MGKNARENALEQKLEYIYQTHGLQVFMQVCAEMLNIKDRANWEKKKKVNGEVCETLVRIMTNDYLRTHHYEGTTFSSIVLKDLTNPHSAFRTELDFTLLTPSFCVTGECKSFFGQVDVTEECLLNRGDLHADVARQSKLHDKCLGQYLRQLAVPGQGRPDIPHGAFCFVFSNGMLHDRRTNANRNRIPVMTVGTLYSYYDQLFSRFKGRVLDYEKACKVFQQAADSEQLHAEHKRYLGY